MTESRRKRLRRHRRRREIMIHGTMTFLCNFLIALIIYFAWTLFVKAQKKIEQQYNIESTAFASDEKQEEAETVDFYMNETVSDEVLQKLTTFAEENDFSVTEYPEELIELLRKNSDTEEFVLNYPLKRDTYSTSDLTELENADGVPLIMQWDERWGYYIYGDNVMGLTGCGPTCLSMVASYLLDDPALTPLYMADFSVRNGYCVNGSGTSWELMSQGAKKLGLYVKEVPLSEEMVMQYLEEGKSIISIMGEGDFTDNGHYIVFVGTKDGKIKVNDPNSYIRSEKLWEFEDIMYQIKNMWVFEA